MAKRLLVHSVNVTCCNENRDSLQQVPLIRSGDGTYCVPDEFQCPICGARFQIDGGLHIVETQNCSNPCSVDVQKTNLLERWGFTG